MFLSELLPPALIDSIVLLDKAWPMHSQRISGPTSGQINPAHIWLEGWPIRLTTSKNNLKTPSGRRCIQRTIFAPAPGPVAILGIHLCGQLRCVLLSCSLSLSLCVCVCVCVYVCVCGGAGVSSLPPFLPLSLPCHRSQPLIDLLCVELSRVLTICMPRRTKHVASKRLSFSTLALKKLLWCACCCFWQSIRLVMIH